MSELVKRISEQIGYVVSDSSMGPLVEKAIVSIFRKELSAVVERVEKAGEPISIHARADESDKKPYAVLIKLDELAAIRAEYGLEE